MSFILFVLTGLCFLHEALAVNWTATPYIPPSVPLAVRSPYLSVWLPQGAGSALNDQWPMFWTGQDIIGWAGFAKVDNVAYVWMGAPGVPDVTFIKATQKSLQWTATQSRFVMTAGPVDLNITFLSPVEPSDLVNQSLPLSYYSVTATSNDGKSHNVQIYVDISAEWVGGTRDTDPLVNWNTTAGDVLTHQVQLTNQVPFASDINHILHGAAYHSTLNTTGTTYQTGQDIIVRAQFVQKGVLTNTLDTNFRGIGDNWPVFAFAHDFGAVTSATAPVVYSVGHARDPAVQYILVNNGRQAQSSYFWSRFSTMEDAIETFLKDYHNALARANEYDNKLFASASAISVDYASLVALSIRQAFGAIEITAPRNSDRTLDTSKVLTFMKQMANISHQMEMANQFVNTVDVIYSSWPLFLYSNPVIATSLIEPLLQYQSTGQYPNDWCVHDMGENYPNATGHNGGQDLSLPIEETGNILIMALSAIQWSSDATIAQTYIGILDQWARYLVANTLHPANQMSSDTFKGPLANQTNLAIKGIIGIQAMAEMTQLAGDSEKAANYSSIAAKYVQQWKQLSTAPSGSHLVLKYGDDTSWGLAYNLYADKLLKTNLIPSDVYDMQTSWYNGKSNQFGLILDTRNSYTKSDWSIFTAAIVSSTDVRDQIIKAVSNFASDMQNSLPLTDWYDASNGKQASAGYYARPVVGAHLAVLALQAASNLNTTLPTPSSGPNGSTTPSASPSSTSRKSSSLSTREYHRVFAIFSTLCTIICVSGTML